VLNKTPRYKSVRRSSGVPLFLISVSDGASRHGRFTPGGKKLRYTIDLIIGRDQLVGTFRITEKSDGIEWSGSRHGRFVTGGEYIRYPIDMSLGRAQRWYGQFK